MKSILDNTNIIVSRRQPKNLKKLLTRAEFSSEPSIKNVSKCDESKCGTCNILITGHYINFKNGKRCEIKSALSRPHASQDTLYMSSYVQNVTAFMLAKRNTYGIESYYTKNK